MELLLFANIERIVQMSVTMVITIEEGYVKFLEYKGNILKKITDAVGEKEGELWHSGGRLPNGFFLDVMKQKLEDNE